MASDGRRPAPAADQVSNGSTLGAPPDGGRRTFGSSRDSEVGRFGRCPRGRRRHTASGILPGRRAGRSDIWPAPLGGGHDARRVCRPGRRGRREPSHRRTGGPRRCSSSASGSPARSVRSPECSRRGCATASSDADLLADELGDVAYYWARLCVIAGAVPSALLRAAGHMSTGGEPAARRAGRSSGPRSMTLEEFAAWAERGRPVGDRQTAPTPGGCGTPASPWQGMPARLPSVSGELA